MKIFKKGFNYSQDGQGNRLVYHVAGCNMHCLWCANPEGMRADGDFGSVTAEEICAEAVRCKIMFIDGGGVTFTGGEASLDAQELICVLSLLKKNGINTALETNGTSPELMRILEYVDHPIMDIKHCDDEKMKKYTGNDGTVTLNNYRLICESGRKCLIRIPLINEFNGNDSEFLAEYLARYANENITFELLRYHEYGRQKWKTPYMITDGFVTDETVREYENAFFERGLKLINT